MPLPFHGGKSDTAHTHTYFAIFLIQALHALAASLILHTNHNIRSLRELLLRTLRAVPLILLARGLTAGVLSAGRSSAHTLFTLDIGISLHALVHSMFPTATDLVSGHRTLLCAFRAGDMTIASVGARS